jgi:iron complex transport system substrate-binding protein
VNSPSPRVVSLLPAATEWMGQLGCIEHVVGRSHACNSPSGISHVPCVTQANDNGWSLDKDLLLSLDPDLVLVQNSCSVCSPTALDLPSDLPTCNLDANRIEEILELPLVLGEAIGRKKNGAECVAQLREDWWGAIDHVAPYVPGPTALVLEWTDPLFVAGHWTPQMIQAAGARPLLITEPGERSIAFTTEEVIASDTDWIIISPCGLDAEATREASEGLRAGPVGELRAMQEGRWIVVEGTRGFSRPGPGLFSLFRGLVATFQNKPELATPNNFGMPDRPSV